MGRRNSTSTMVLIVQPTAKIVPIPRMTDVVIRRSIFTSIPGIDKQLTRQYNLRCNLSVSPLISKETSVFRHYRTNYWPFTLGRELLCEFCPVESLRSLC
jgi:hypothetical protein